MARICWSLNVPGSDSSALQMAYLTSPGAMPRTSSHFCPVGNPAPPIPRNPAPFSVCTIVSGSSSPASSARRVA